MATYIVQTPEYSRRLLTILLTALGDLHLYKNDVVPDRTVDSHAVYTEATATGYAALSAAGGWTVPADEGNGTAFSDHIDFTFTVTADSAEQYVYGWYLLDTGGQMVGSQRGEGADFPFPFYRAGDRVVVRIRLTQESYGPPPPPAP